MRIFFGLSPLHILIREIRIDEPEILLARDNAPETTEIGQVQILGIVSLLVFPRKKARALYVSGRKKTDEVL